MSTSTKPYFLRALYEWCVDNGHTPYVMVWVNEHTKVPMQFVQEEQIVLNIGPAASHNLHIDNDWMHFSARFSGVAQDIWIPVGHVISLYARETGEGMGFEVEPYTPESTSGQAAAKTAETEASPDAPAKKTKGLKLVK
ncbi:MAG: ClpXP protease specificity-enhancing factor [Eikenella sp.]|nr:ClpXP protease specificity-enhancing factor [Eikenella sp.]